MLIGAVTTLVIVVAVFLAYNANNGLPFVPTRELDVLVSNGANLVKGNEVRSGGFRIGVVTDMTPVMLPNGKVGARAARSSSTRRPARVPVDSKRRHPAALGAGAEVRRARHRALEEGLRRRRDACPPRQASVPVELDEFFNMFDEPTRRASQGNLQGFGDALAGRGADINQTIQVAPELFDHLGSVMANLSAPRTELPSFFKELGDAARVIAPVSETNAHLFTTMANTFEALSRDPQALKDTIAKSPPTLRAGTSSLRVQRPFLEHTAALSRDLDTRRRPSCARALPTVNSALRVGTPVQRRSVALNDELAGRARRARGPRQGADHGRLAARPDGDGGHAAAAAALPRPVRHGLQHLEHLLDLRRRAPLGARRHRLLAARAAQHGHAGSPGPTASARRAPTSSPTARARCPAAPTQYVHNNVYAPAVDEKGNADCGAGQTGYIQAYNPLRDKSVKGDPYQGAVTERFPITGRPRARPTRSSTRAARASA